jgi:hypothetical protein
LDGVGGEGWGGREKKKKKKRTNPFKEGSSLPIMKKH